MKQKIAFCIPDMVIGGVETVFITILNELLKNPDLEIVVVTHVKIRTPIYTRWFAAHPELRVHVYYPLGNWFQDMTRHCHWGPLKILRRLAFSLYKKYRRVIMWGARRLADVDVFIDYKNLSFAKELKYFRQPKIAWLHTALSYFSARKMSSRLPQYDRVIGLTDDFVTDFKAAYPQYADKICRLYNSLDIAGIRARADATPSPNGKYFCHVARLVAGKDIKTLLDAFDVFYVNHPDVGLYIVGDGDMATCFREYAGTLRCGANVVFTGALDNPYGIMRGAIANILSSEFEGFGMVLIESQVLGTLAISSNCKNGPREILMDGRAGLLFDVGDVAALAGHMETAACDCAVRNKMIKTATDGLGRFTVTEICNQITQVIAGV